MTFTAVAVLRNVALAIVFIGVLVGALVFVATREDRRNASPSSPTNEPRPTNPRSRDGGLTATQAREALGRIAEASHSLMPRGYEALYISMPLEALRHARPSIRRAGRGQSDASETWEEDDPSGARVIYVVSRDAQLLEQVQFASRIDDARAGLAPHLTALQERYQSPTGVWDCPQTTNASPVRRFTWRRPDASLMEAVLLVGNMAAITLVIAPTDDIGRALQRSQCHAVTTPEEIARFPIASEIRGDRQDFVREIPH